MTLRSGATLQPLVQPTLSFQVRQQVSFLVLQVNADSAPREASYTVAGQLRSSFPTMSADQRAIIARNVLSEAGLTPPVDTQSTPAHMDNFAIQMLMSEFNESEALASSVSKKREDTNSSVVQKIG